MSKKNKIMIQYSHYSSRWITHAQHPRPAMSPITLHVGKQTDTPGGIGTYASHTPPTAPRSTVLAQPGSGGTQPGVKVKRESAGGHAADHSSTTSSYLTLDPPVMYRLPPDPPKTLSACHRVYGTAPRVLEPRAGAAAPKAAMDPGTRTAWPEWTTPRRSGPRGRGSRWRSPGGGPGSQRTAPGEAVARHSTTALNHHAHHLSSLPDLYRNKGSQSKCTNQRS